MLALRLAAPKLCVKFAAHPKAIVALYSSVLFFVMLGSARTFTFHESFTAQGAREMLATGDWLIPRVGGRPWLEKPPLPQWLAAASGAAIGRVDEFSSRLPAGIAGLIGILAVTGLVQRYRGANAAMMTGLMLATMTSIITYARLAEPDIFLWAIVVAALAVFARNQIEPVAERAWWSSAIAFFLLLGLTQTVKGPLFGAVMVLAPCVAWLVVHRVRNSKCLLSPTGWLLGLGVAVAWPIAVLAEFPEALELWKYHTVGRLDSTVAYNAKPVWYYFTTLPWQAAPAILFALPALPRSLKAAWRESSLDRFLWLWFGSQLLALSAASGKHHHYLIYALPPIAVWAAAGVTWYAQVLGRLWSYRGYRYVSPIAAIAILTAAAVYAQQKQIVAAWEVLAVGGFVIAGMVLVARACFRQRDEVAAASFAVVLAGVLLYVNTVWLPRTDIYKPDGELARRVGSSTPAETTIIVYNIEPARLLLDLGRNIQFIKNDPKELRRAVAGRECVILTAELFLAEVAGVLTFVESDRTPNSKWRGSPISQMVALKVLAAK